jgi:hypothetical protein
MEFAVQFFEYQLQEIVREFRPIYRHQRTKELKARVSEKTVAVENKKDGWETRIEALEFYRWHLTFFYLFFH